MGDPEKIGGRYLELNFSQEARADLEDRADLPDDRPEQLTADTRERIGDGRAEIVDAWFEDDLGRRTEALQTGKSCAVTMRVRFHEDVENPGFSVELLNSQRDELFAASTVTDDPRPGLFHAGEDVTDRRERFLPVMITSTHRSGALAELPHHIELERTGPPAAVAGDGSTLRARREARKVRS
jgi:hypothetical protein